MSIPSPTELEKIVLYISSLKKKHNFEVVDAHIHPLDVMGWVPFVDNKSSELISPEYYKKGGILEFFQYGAIINLLSPVFYKLFPNIVRDIIKKTYSKIGTQRLLSEMQLSEIDKAVLIPIEPWARTEIIKKSFNDSHFYLECSIDIHNTTVEKAKENIHNWKTGGIVGIKLHPNLQSFYPQPSRNPENINKLLSAIYQFAEKEKMYLHFHAGVSFYTQKVDEKYGHQQRSTSKGRLENFVNEDGTSEIFDKYSVPIIISHLGHFGITTLNLKLMNKLVKKYPNIYFDTAGASPSNIANAIQAVTADKIIFGSDGIYNKLIFSIYYIHRAIESLQINQSDKEIAYKKILGNNFLSLWQKV